MATPQRALRRQREVVAWVLGQVQAMAVCKDGPQRWSLEEAMRGAPSVMRDEEAAGVRAYLEAIIRGGHP